MKRFDKGYIYSGLVSDFFGCLVIAFIFLKDFFLDDEVKKEDMIGAIPIFAAVFILIYLCFVALYPFYPPPRDSSPLSQHQAKCSTAARPAPGCMHRAPSRPF